MTSCQMGWSKLSALGLLCFSLVFSWDANARDAQILDRGVYFLLGFGAGYGTSIEYTPNVRIGFYDTIYPSLNLGLIWKRDTPFGRQSSFLVNYHPINFNLSLENRNPNHVYRQMILSFDFIESYGFFGGWSPNIGVNLALHNLYFDDTSDSIGPARGNRIRIGFAGGWDLLPSPDSHWRIRTTFRFYPYPETKLRYAGNEFAFTNFQIDFFNFLYRF